MYGKAMSIPDSLLADYFELLTDVPDAELNEIKQDLAGGKVNPMLLKKRLAGMLVADFHGAEAARVEEEYFTRVFQERKGPEEVQKVPLDELLAKLRAAGSPPVETGDVTGEGKWYIVDVPRLVTVLGFAGSQGEAKRLISQKAVEIDGSVVAEPGGRIHSGTRIRVGKRRFAELV